MEKKICRKENKKKAWKDMTCCSGHTKTSIMKFKDWQMTENMQEKETH